MLLEVIRGPVISIHALLAESDPVLRLLIGARAISIHALLAESDVCLRLPGGQQDDFNPRSPCGERLLLLRSLGP